MTATPTLAPQVGPDRDRRFLAHAIGLARESAAAGQLPFGALVVLGGTVIGAGTNTEKRDHDPLAHAEVAAVRAAAGATRQLSLRGAVLYSSCEPCALCHVAAAVAGISRIVYAAPKEAVPDLGGTAMHDHAAVLTDMQQALRAVSPERLVHLPVAGADKPFGDYLARQAPR